MERLTEKQNRCCNTCKHQDESFYGCSKPKECYNGFSAYETNEIQAAHEEAEKALEEEK